MVLIVNLLSVVEKKNPNQWTFGRLAERAKRGGALLQFPLVQLAHIYGSRCENEDPIRIIRAFRIHIRSTRFPHDL